MLTNRSRLGEAESSWRCKPEESSLGTEEHGKRTAERS
jgi:hypothetical protein